MEPCVAFYCYVAWHFPQCEQLLTAVFLQLLFLVSQFALYVAQHARLLVFKTVDYLVELFYGETCHEALRLAYVLVEQVPYYFRVACAHHQSEHVALAALFLFLLILAVAAYEEINHEYHERHLYHYASVEHQQAHYGTCREGCSCRYEPSSDDAQHSCHAEHGALAAPYAVGKA